MKEEDRGDRKEDDAGKDNEKEKKEEEEEEEEEELSVFMVIHPLSVIPYILSVTRIAGSRYLISAQYRSRQGRFNIIKENQYKEFIVRHW